MKIYAASSWKNEVYPEVVAVLKEKGHEVYDFRENGFNWRDIDPNWRKWTNREYMEKGLASDEAQEGFNRDYEAMKWADAFILVLPCGRSAHLEAGWAIGQRKPTAFFLSEGDPDKDLMYLLSPVMVDTLDGVRRWANLTENALGMLMFK